jgi:hypothetical protein
MPSSCCANSCVLCCLKGWQDDQRRVSAGLGYANGKPVRSFLGELEEPHILPLGMENLSTLLTWRPSSLKHVEFLQPDSRLNNLILTMMRMMKTLSCIASKAGLALDYGYGLSPSMICFLGGQWERMERYLGQQRLWA